LEAADHAGGSYSLEQAAEGTREADVYLGDAEFDIAVGALLGEVNVIYTDNFAAFGVNDLLIEKVLADGEPGFVRLIGVESTLADGEFEAAGLDGGDLIKMSNEGLEAAARDEEVRDAIGLLGGLNKEFADTANVIALGVVSLRAHEFGGEKHVVAPF
jgi:hypothetical protein